MDSSQPRSSSQLLPNPAASKFTFSGVDPLSLAIKAAQVRISLVRKFY